MEDVKSGFVVGKGIVEGVRCDHLAFRAPQVDWQIWIQEGKQPLPRKLVITSTDVAGAPQFSVVMTKWNLAPKIAAASFVFTFPDRHRFRAGCPCPALLTSAGRGVWRRLPWCSPLAFFPWRRRRKSSPGLTPTRRLA